MPGLPSSAMVIRFSLQKCMCLEIDKWTNAATIRESFAIYSVSVDVDKKYMQFVDKFVTKFIKNLFIYHFE